MSKCDLAIVFDRTDRRFRGGEEVTGTAHVQVRDDCPCNRILLEHFWQTHGRGNRATGPKQTTVLDRGPLQAGQSLSYPFRFTAPNGPPTYHGRYLNIDHYVHLRVDVPWAIDPKLKEEYLLVPGGGRYGNVPRGRLGVKQGVLGLGVPIGAAMVLGGFFFLPCGIVLIGVGLVVLFFALRKSIAEKKIGKVRLSWGSSTVAPGSRLPLRLAFTPNQSARLNRITAKLVGKERCVSGSGTNRTTHTHKFHERTFMLASECEMNAGRPIRVDGAVPIPETAAYSFHASDNDVLWELEIRIDIPFWPDWIEKGPVIVRPAVEPEVVEVTVVEEPAGGGADAAQLFPVVEEQAGAFQPPRGGPAMPVAPVEPARQTFTDRREPSPAEQREPVAAEGPGPLGDASATDAGRPFGEAPATELPTTELPTTELPTKEAPAAETSQPAPSESPQPEPETPEPEAPVEERPAEPAATTDPALVTIVERIATADRYTREREQILEENSDKAFDCQIEVTRAERTYSYVPDQRFRQGRTVTGKLRGTHCEVAVQVVAARNDEIDALGPGGMLHAKCTPLKWNTIYDRLEMRQA
jgi:hypothetical protein